MNMIKVLLFILIPVQLFANIPHGNYKIEKIQCQSGKVMKLGGKFMIYEIYLNIKENEMTMTAKANSADWAPFKLNCTQINQGTFRYTQEGQFEGELPNISVECNNPTWTNILKKRLFGVEDFGEFNYKFQNNQLAIHNKDTITKYSCDQTGDYPIYYYKKI
jgi:hypothetical protein